MAECVICGLDNDLKIIDFNDTDKGYISIVICEKCYKAIIKDYLVDLLFKIDN